MNTALDLKTTDCSTAARGLQQCYQSHPPLPLGQHTIYGGNAETPIVRDAHLYVTLQEGSSCDLPAHRWDVKTSDLPLNPWKPGRQVIEAYFPIPDGHIPDDADQFKYLIHWVCTQLESKKKIHIGCIGGHGRTGMVMAAITAKFFGEMDAIQYVRNHYCSKAVESESQVHFLMEHYAVSSAETELNASWNTGKKSDYSSTFDSEHGFGCNDELALYREHVGPLSKRGKGFVAHCPLHTDIHPSLRIDTRKGKWLWYCDPCNQGGNIHQLLRRMGMQNLPYRSKSTLAEVSGPNPPVALGEPAATYPYLDASGKLAFEVLRFEYADVEGRRKKEFRQRRPDVNGGWHLNVPSDVRTIYNLPAVLAADTVLVCEGEKDCNTAAEHGFIATCNPMGAGKWEDRYSEFLRGKQVVIIPDVDEAGEKHSTRVFTSVRTCAQSVKIVRLPFGKDLTEWMEKGGTAGELKKLITTTAAEELTVPPVFQKPATFAKTDSGNAERFAAEHGNSVRHCHAIGKWYLWDGECWAKDDIGGVFRLAKQTVRQIYAEALELQDDEQRRALTRHALQSESAPRINAMLSLARSEPGIPVRLTDLDCDPLLLNVRNGTIDLRDGQLREHRREDLLTKLAPLFCDPSAGCPQWLGFLDAVTAGNNQLAKYLQRAVGYSLTGDTKEHALFVLYGAGANGKSTFLEAMRNVLGDYAQTADFSTFMASQRSPGPRNDLAKLNGARFVTATESEDGMRLAESFIKQITGGDTVTARFLYSEHFEFKPQFKAWLGTNHKPEIRGTDDGIWRRIRLIPFTVRIPDKKRDRNMGEKLRAEAAGILNWALEGLVEYREHGLQEPEAVIQATEEYRVDQDMLGHFLDARCVVNTDSKVKARDLYTAFKGWATATGEQIMNERRFSKYLSERGFASVRHGAGRLWKGIAIVEECHPPGGNEDLVVSAVL